MKFPNLWDTKIEKKYASKKKITQNNIYTVWQFAYVHKIVGISLFIGKITRCSSTVFISKKPTHENSNL